MSKDKDKIVSIKKIRDKQNRNKDKDIEFGAYVTFYMFIENKGIVEAACLLSEFPEHLTLAEMFMQIKGNIMKETRCSEDDIVCIPKEAYLELRKSDLLSDKADKSGNKITTGE